MANPTEAQNPDINLALPLDAVNYLLQVLDERPFKEVEALVGAVRSQAGEQVNAYNEKMKTES